MADEVRQEMTKAHLSGDFKLPWTIPAGVHDDNNTGMRFEFLHGDDGSPILHVFSNARDKFLRVLFGEHGVVASDVRPFPDPGEANLQKQLAQAQADEAGQVALATPAAAGKDYHD